MGVRTDFPIISFQSSQYQFYILKGAALSDSRLIFSLKLIAQRSSF